MDDKSLLGMAKAARSQAYAPYSGYRVGAALEAENGTIFTGCNVENASYGATCCAERTAIFKAVSEGIRRIKRIAIAGGTDEGLNYAYPCGICRQVLREFCDPDELKIIVGTSDSDIKTYTLAELLPDSFGPDFKNTP
ncbi:MAG: cytidine deaminase [Lachnospiraceae bacterium]|nr:cytidine deaminase [Lachnospiraceae bacterium]